MFRAQLANLHSLGVLEKLPKVRALPRHRFALQWKAFENACSKCQGNWARQRTE